MAELVPLVKTSQVALVIVAVVFGLIATVAITLRLLAARIANRRLDASDYSILAAWLLMLGLMITCILEAAMGGFGWHYDEILRNFGYRPIKQYHIILMPLEILWTLSLTTTKLSVLLFYIRVFAVTGMSKPAKMTMVLVALLGTSGVMCTLLICRPINYNWDLAIVSGHCGSQSAVFAVFGIMNLVTDFAVLTMPIPGLMKLRMPFWKKASLIATFTVGFLTCVASIIRLVYLARINYDDVTYTSVTAVLMTAVEPSLAVMLACIPLLRPLVGRKSRASSVHRPKQSRRISTLLSGGWSRSRGFRGASKKLSTWPGASPRIVRLGSSEATLGFSRGGMRSSTLSPSKYDTDDAMELRYVLTPGEDISHRTCVEALRRSNSTLAVESETIRQRLQDVEAGHGGSGGGGFAIVVKQEWNVEREPR